MEVWQIKDWGQRWKDDKDGKGVKKMDKKVRVANNINRDYRVIWGQQRK